MWFYESRLVISVSINRPQRINNKKKRGERDGKEDLSLASVRANERANQSRAGKRAFFIQKGALSDGKKGASHA